MNHPQPLLNSEASVYCRHPHPRQDDEVDVDAVEASIPSPPVGELRNPESESISSSSYARSAEKILEAESVGDQEGLEEQKATLLRGFDVNGEDARDIDERQCRICFDGPDDEEVLGRLISPCLCAGSMRVSHCVCCLGIWS